MQGWGASERETAEFLLREPLAESGVLVRSDREPLSWCHLNYVMPFPVPQGETRGDDLPT
jgi:hypothetical protein